MLKWWEVPKNCECIFALDYESVITEDSIISPSNNTINYLITKDSVKGRVNKTFSGVLKAKTFTSIFDKIFLYKAIKLNDINLIFNQEIPLSNKQTWFLICKLNGSSVLSTGLNNGSHGLTYDTISPDTKYSKNWRVAGFVSGQEYSFDKREQSLVNLHKVVVKNDMETSKINMTTNYGYYTESYDNNSSFSSPYSLKVLGYADPYWYPKIEIIAYGLFDGIISDEDLSTMETLVDENFLISSKDLQHKNIELIEYSNLFENFSDSNDFEELLLKESLKGIYTKADKPFRQNYQLLEKEMKTAPLLYKNIKNIEDIVLEEGLPVNNVTVFLSERNSGILLKTTVSDIDGRFFFYNLSPELEYTITANDNKYQFGSIIKNYNR